MSLWTGVLADERATEWELAGVSGGIPSSTWANCTTAACNTLCCGTTSACGTTCTGGTVTVASIGSAASSAPVNSVVRLSAGSFTLGGFNWSRSNAVLRGTGADTTTLNVNSLVPTGCHIGEGHAVNICTGSGNNIGSDPDGENTATWDAGYAKGTTVITLSNVTNLALGRAIWLDQLGEAADGFPTAGDIWITNWGSGQSFMRSGRFVLEGHIVTDINGLNVTISPGVHMPDFRAGRSPGAWWGSSGTIITNTGFEDFTLDSTLFGPALYVINATGVWLKGMRVMYRVPVTTDFRFVNFINVVHATVQSNYFYGFQATDLVSKYGIVTGPVSGLLFHNNIVHASLNPLVVNTATYGNVFAYNYWNNVGLDPNFSQPSIIFHGLSSMNLLEGNHWRNFSSDNIHASHMMMTAFRNNMSGEEFNPSDTEAQAAAAVYGGSRFFNIVGNVMGAAHWTTYANVQSPPSQCQTCIYELGWQGTNAGGIAATGNDTHVNRTLMRWGNYDSVSAAVRFVSAEVPSGITTYANPVPATTTLPNSMYLAAQPTEWWSHDPAWAVADPPWPPIGPDVTAGVLVNTAGHAYRTPSRLCFENMSNDPAFLTSSPRIKLFRASTCYQAATSTGGGETDDELMSDRRLMSEPV